MDILTHTLSGLAVGTVFASFSTNVKHEKLFSIGVGGFAGALPDLDAISLWSGFDSTFGKIFSLNLSGKEIYSSKLWYSHHAFMHSIVAALLLAIVLGILLYFRKVGFRRFNVKELIMSFTESRLILYSFLIGFFIHLLEDMPTPASSWGGVNLFWPSTSYIGGQGNIWWWNNYDIFLIVLCVLILNLIILTFSRIQKRISGKLTIVVFIIGLLLSSIQISSRDFDFNYEDRASNYNEFELKSKELQREILGDRVYKVMVDFDNKLKIYF